MQAEGSMLGGCLSVLVLPVMFFGLLGAHCCYAQATPPLSGPGVVPPGKLGSEWGEECVPAYMLETVSDVSVVQCGDKGHKYSICGEDSTQRKQEADEMDPCECAKRCHEDRDCEVMAYQEDTEHTERAPGKWVNTRCFLYKTCVVSDYTANKNSWCMAIGRPILAPPSTNLGWLFIVAVTLCTAGYVGGGIAYGKRSGATAAPSFGDTLSVLRVHPHFDRWLEFQGLAADGLRFARGGGSGGSGGGGSASRTSHASHHGGRGHGEGYGAVAVGDGGDRDADDKDRKRHRRSSKKKKEKSTQDVREANSPRAGAKGSVRKNNNKDKQLVDAPVDVAAAPGPASGTAAGGGGRWVHVPN